MSFDCLIEWNWREKRRRIKNCENRMTHNGDLLLHSYIKYNVGKIFHTELKVELIYFCTPGEKKEGMERVKDCRP